MCNATPTAQNKLIGLLCAGKELRSTNPTRFITMLDIKNDLQIGDFIRIWWEKEEIFTVGVFKGISGKKVLIQETRSISKDGKSVLFNRFQYWAIKDIEGNIARIDV